MAIEIKKISDNRYTVNGKLVFRNSENQWVCPSLDLTPNEERAFYNYTNAMELNLEERKN